MKKIVLFPFLIALVKSRKKVDPISALYYGTWIAETPQVLSTNNRIHTLKIYTDPKGRPYGEYTSTGQYALFDKSVDGFVMIDGEQIRIKKKEFTIEQAPNEKDKHEMAMQLSTLAFRKV